MIIIKRPPSTEELRKLPIIIRPVSDWSKYYIPEPIGEMHEEIWSRITEKRKK